MRQSFWLPCSRCISAGRACSTTPGRAYFTLINNEGGNVYACGSPTGRITPGNIVPTTMTRFKENYDMASAKSKVSSEYRPTLKNLRSGETFDLVEHIRSCINKGSEYVYMKPIKDSVKIFTVWDANNYVRGTEGDYIAIRENDLSDFYIVEKDLFDQTYEPADK